MQITDHEDFRKLVEKVADRDKFIWKDLVDEFNISVDRGFNSLKRVFKNTTFSVIDLRGLDTSNVTNMRSAFSFCRELVKLDLTDFNTSKVEDMSFMFSGCKNLKELNLSSFDTSSVRYMRSIFAGCLDLIDLDISSFRTPKLKEMKTMFSGCRSLKALDLSNFYLDRVDLEPEVIKNVYKSTPDRLVFLEGEIRMSYNRILKSVSCEIKLPEGYGIEDGNLIREENYDTEVDADKFFGKIEQMANSFESSNYF